MNFKIILLLTFFLIPTFIIPSFADNSYFNSTLAQLNVFQSSKHSISVFYPIFFLVIVAVFMAIGLLKRNDSIASIFTIGATVICIVLSLMFISPLEFTTTSTETKITTEQTQLPDSLVNSTSVVKDSFTNLWIPNDLQFRLILSSFFMLLGLLNGLFTIMIVTRWSKDKN